MFERLKHFILESRRELARVNWPTRDETMRLTGVVVAISLTVSIFLGAFDALFFVGVKYVADLAPVSALPNDNLQPNSSTTSSTQNSNEVNNFIPVNVNGSGDVTVSINTPKPASNPKPATSSSSN